MKSSFISCNVPQCYGVRLNCLVYGLFDWLLVRVRISLASLSRARASAGVRAHSLHSTFTIIAMVKGGK